MAPSQMVGVSASVNLPLHHKVQKFFSGIGSHGWSRQRAVKRLWWCGGGLQMTLKVRGRWKLIKFVRFLGEIRNSRVDKTGF